MTRRQWARLPQTSAIDLYSFTARFLSQLTSVFQGSGKSSESHVGVLAYTEHEPCYSRILFVQKFIYLFVSHLTMTLAVPNIRVTDK
jgi:hypothetical protein